MKITVGIPAFNEERKIGKIISQIQKITDSIIVCNDGSSDLTSEISRKMGVDVIDHSRNLGYGAAIKSIFLKARELNSDILVTFDADGQHRIEDIEKVVSPIKNAECEIVIGSRFLGDSINLPKYRRVGIKTITKITNLVTNSKISDSQSGFRAYSNRALNEIFPSEEGMGVSTEILIKADKQNFRIKEVPITILYDGDTSTHNPVSHGTSVLLKTLKFISIEKPLSFYGIPGIILLGIGLFFLVWVIQIFSESRVIGTNIAIIGIGSTLIGILLIMTAILLFSLVNVVRERNNHHGRL